MGLYGNEKKMGFKHIIGKDDTDQRYHSGFYHRFFEGYTEVRHVKPNGGFTIERIYTGKYYEQELSLPQVVLLRLAYLLLAIGTGLGFLTGGFHECTKVLAVVNCVLILMLVALVLTLGNYLLAPRRMKIYEYKSSSESLKMITLIVVIALAVLFLGRLGLMLWSGTLLEGWRDLCWLLFGAGCSGAMTLVERKIPYRSIKNQLENSIDGIEIGM
jgi:hypothetical protein